MSLRASKIHNILQSKSGKITQLESTVALLQKHVSHLNRFHASIYFKGRKLRGSKKPFFCIPDASLLINGILSILKPDVGYQGVQFPRQREDYYRY